MGCTLNVAIKKIEGINAFDHRLPTTVTGLIMLVIILNWVNIPSLGTIALTLISLYWIARKCLSNHDFSNKILTLVIMYCLFLFTLFPMLGANKKTVMGFMISNDSVAHIGNTSDTLLKSDIDNTDHFNMKETYPNGFHRLHNYLYSSLLLEPIDSYQPLSSYILACAFLSLVYLFGSRIIALIATLNITTLSFALVGFSPQILFQVFLYLYIANILKRNSMVVTIVCTAGVILVYGVGGLIWYTLITAVLLLTGYTNIKHIVISTSISICLCINQLYRLYEFTLQALHVSLDVGNVQKYLPVYQLFGFGSDKDYRYSYESKPYDFLMIVLMLIAGFYSSIRNGIVFTLILITIVCMLFFSITGGWYIWAKNIAVISPLFLGGLLLYIRMPRLQFTIYSVLLILIIVQATHIINYIPVWDTTKLSDLRAINALQLSDNSKVLFIDYFDPIRLVFDKPYLATPFNLYYKERKYPVSGYFQPNFINWNSFNYIIIDDDNSDIEHYYPDHSTYVKNALQYVHDKKPIYKGESYTLYQTP